MMNTSKKFLKDVTNIFSSVPETVKLIIRAITPNALKFNYAQPLTIPTNQFGRRAPVAKQGDMVSTTVLHGSHQII